jgi:hypothetical protein
VVVCLLLVAALFGPAGYLAVWGKLTSALEGAGIAKVTAGALWQARTSPRSPPGAGLTHSAHYFACSIAARLSPAI